MIHFTTHRTSKDHFYGIQTEKRTKMPIKNQEHLKKIQFIELQSSKIKFIVNFAYRIHCLGSSNSRKKYFIFNSNRLSLHSSPCHQIKWKRKKKKEKFNENLMEIKQIQFFCFPFFRLISCKRFSFIENRFLGWQFAVRAISSLHSLLACLVCLLEFTTFLYVYAKVYTHLQRMDSVSLFLHFPLCLKCVLVWK